MPFRFLMVVSLLCMERLVSKMSYYVSSGMFYAAVSITLSPSHCSDVYCCRYPSDATYCSALWRRLSILLPVIIEASPGEWQWLDISAGTPNAVAAAEQPTCNCMILQ